MVIRVVTIPATTRDVGELINEKYAEEKAVSRQSLLKFLSNICFLVRQALPMRGKRESNSNFNQLYHLRGEDNPFLMELAKLKGSHNMQEEMVKVMALKIFREIAAEISSGEFYAIMADEPSRWVDDDLNP